MAADPGPLLTRAMAHALAYRRSLAEDPRLPSADYHAMLERFVGAMPEQGTPAGEVIEALATQAIPGLMPMAGPRFFGWVIGASHPAGVAADWLVSAWGQNTGFHSPTPATAAIEAVAERWLLEVLDLPPESSVGFSTGATVANAIGLAAARTGVLLASGWDPDADGLFGAPPVEVLIGADAHSSVFSSLQLIGFGYRRVTTVDTDGEGRMQPQALARALGAGSGPKIVIAQAGQINTGAFDPFTEVVALSKAAGAWVHVDGAFGLWARAVPGLRRLTDGIEGADSWVTDGHKWLQAPYDCGFAIVRDRAIHQRAMTQWSSYLPTIGKSDRVPSAFVPELSRRARGVPVYALLRTLGREGVAELVAHHCALARRFAELLAGEPGVRVLNAVVLNQVIVSFGEGDAASRRAATEAVIARVQKGGVCFAAGAEWRGDWVMRLSVTSGATTARDIDISAAAIVAAWRAERVTQSREASAAGRGLTSTVARESMPGIPIIDIRDLRSDDPAARHAVAALVGSACREVGFFVITGHGVASALIADTFAASAAFFAQPDEAKRAMAIGRLGSNRGYVGPGVEALDEKSGADHKEAFNLIWTDGRIRPANVWPELPGFQAVVQRYFDALLEVGRQLHSAFAMDLGLEADFFADKIDRPLATLRLLHYPVPRADAPVGQIGAGAHTDYGNVTLLATDGVAGLQVRRRDGTWVDAPALPGAFICNIGDCLMRWTNDIYVSTPHRVLRPAAERYSIAMFVDPNPEAIVRAIPSCVPEGESPRHPPISAHDYLQQRFASTYGPRSS